MNNDLVSVIMLSKDKGQYVEESVRSVIAQTYQNWELIFMDDSSKDDTISQMMDLMEEDRKRMLSLSKRHGPSTSSGAALPVNRIHVSQNVESKGSAASMNSALRDARGKWIAFLNVGDLWEPTKLEKQVAFVEQNGYAFTYTKYKYIDKDSKIRGDMMGGLEVVSHKDLTKCCWMGYLTVMYDADKLGRFQVRNIEKHNDYALWMDVSEKADCYLFPECLASLRVNHRLLSPLPMFDKLRWRYEVFHTVEDLNPFISVWLTIRNMIGGFVKKMKYVERVKR
jgi:glycosyltransferase involved in cell wall biosynthesis